jgi:RimJ/RimL family protein N-acetyltransferase
MNSRVRVEPVTLDGVRVRMEPLDLSRHWPGLLAIGLDPDLWLWTTSMIETEAQLRAYLETAITEQREGRSLPFATIDKASGEVAGCTRYGNIATKDKRIEIGWTWVGVPFRRSWVNTEAKYLMLCHAFETLGCIRVEFKTSAKNQRSRDAMKRIGCVEEGILRKHMLRDNGEPRDSVYLSILDDEWPAVKTRLEGMMQVRT